MSYITVLLSRASCFEALAAVNGSVAAGLESELSFAATLGANCHEILALASLSILSLVAACLAALRLILEALFSIELLLARREDEFLAAISACEGYVLVNDFFSIFYFYFVFTHVFISSLIKISKGIRVRARFYQRVYKSSMRRF